MLMMRANTQKVSPPPVPPRPSKTIVAEALAKSRKLSPVRVLYATQPAGPRDLDRTPPNDGHNGIVHNFAKSIQKDPEKLVANNVNRTNKDIEKFAQKDLLKQDKLFERKDLEKSSQNDYKNFAHKATAIKDMEKPAVPVRSAPPPPVTKPRTLPPSVVKSYSSTAVFKPRSDEPRVNRSTSDCGKDAGETRTVVFQSSNVKTSKIEVQLSRKLSFNSKQAENAKNERNLLTSCTEEKQTIHVSSEDEQGDVKPTTDTQNVVPPEHVEKVQDADVTDIVLSDSKTLITVHSSLDDANNNVFDGSTVLVIEQNGSHSSHSEPDSADSTAERKKRRVQFDDKVNHELLIAELEGMRREQERLLKRQRKPSVDIFDLDDGSESVHSRIEHSDWVEVDNGEEIRLSSCQIYINPEEDCHSSDEPSKGSCLDSRRSRAPSMSSLHGLPPLPKSLSGFNLLEGGRSEPLPRGSFRVPTSPGPQTPSRAGSSRGPTPPTPGSGTGAVNTAAMTNAGHVVYPPHPRLNGTAELPRGRKLTTLDTQLAILRREMYGLRQLDLSLLSQLYSLNEAIQDFRQLLQDQEDTAISPHSRSPSPSSGDDGDEYYSPTPMRFKAAPPVPPHRRTSNSSSANSSEYGTV